VEIPSSWARASRCENLFDYLDRGHGLDEFLDAFPSVSKEQAIAILEHAHEVLTADARVQQRGWAGLQNGELLPVAADAGFDFW
jgi:hypothetical protein